MFIQFTIVAALVFIMNDLNQNMQRSTTAMEVEEVSINASEAVEAEIIPISPATETEHNEQQQDDSIFIIVEEMPIFPGCEGDRNLADACTQREINNFLSQNIEYPQSAIEQGVEGVVYLSFVVTKNGEVANLTVLRGVRGGEMLDREAIRLASKLPNFIPGKQRGKLVSVKYNIPIKFVLP